MVVGGFLMAGLLSAVATPLASGDDRQRSISSMSQLAAPELSQAIKNASQSKTVYLPTTSLNESKTEKVTSGIALPVYSNSFPPMIAQVRTENWD
jgi:hypothetical protein